MTLEQALSTLTDREGNKLEFQKQEDGTYTAEVQSQKGSKYSYGFVLAPQPQFVQVEITKSDKDKEQQKEIEEKSKELAGTKQGAAQVSPEQRATGTLYGGTKKK